MCGVVWCGVGPSAATSDHFRVDQGCTFSGPLIRVELITISSRPMIACHAGKDKVLFAHRREREREREIDNPWALLQLISDLIQFESGSNVSAASLLHRSMLHISQTQSRPPHRDKSDPFKINSIHLTYISSNFN